jgi:aminopeptidase YwaD
MNTSEANGMPTEQARLLSAIDGDTQIVRDFHHLCDCGGRLAGSPGEEQAVAFLTTALDRIGKGKLQVERNRHVLWETTSFSLTHMETGVALEAIPLLGTAPTLANGLLAEVVDMGLGRPEDFDRLGHLLPGRVALVRHEYPFMPDHVHRNTKASMAEQAGACGFLIAYQEQMVGPVSGSSSGEASKGIPSFGISAEAAVQLARSDETFASVRMLCLGRSIVRDLPTIILTVQGESDEVVVVSAHVDGHPLGESAIDNASGLVGALALARAIATADVRMHRTVSFCFFSAEEWDLGGSNRWLDSLTQLEQDRIVLNINLDSIAGDHEFTALTSDFETLPAFVTGAAADVSRNLQVYEPTKNNSDHVNFADRGIPAFRLLAGFGRPQASLRYLLTSRDRRELVTSNDLKEGIAIAAAVLFRAINSSEEELARLRVRRFATM